MELREYFLVTVMGIGQGAIFLLPFIYGFIVAKVNKLESVKQFTLVSGCLTYGFIGILFAVQAPYSAYETFVFPQICAANESAFFCQNLSVFEDTVFYFGVALIFIVFVYSPFYVKNMYWLHNSNLKTKLTT